MKAPYFSQVKGKLASAFSGQKEYLQAVNELLDYVDVKQSELTLLETENILERLLTPDRVISFQVPWLTDEGKVEVNQGWRVQHSNLIGPYKGGLRFHPTVNESVLKFLALEQTFKNALTGMPIGGAKGGSNFDPKGKSKQEVMRFCQSFMDELHRYIGPNTDIPAGDINVGSREIGYLFGRYRRLKNQFSGAITGKHIEFGGSEVRIESTGFGVIFFVEQVLKQQDQSMSSKALTISGSGNVALHTAQKAIELGAKVLTLSNSEGVCYLSSGFSLKTITDLIKQQKRVDLIELANSNGGEWIEGETPWSIKSDIAIPCATQNELHKEDAKKLVENETQFVFEGANMPCTAEAISILETSKVVFAPAKAVNSGGVITSALEMGQNATFFPESFEEVSDKLKTKMATIHKRCLCTNDKSYLKGANSAALNRLMTAMQEQGI